MFFFIIQGNKIIDVNIKRNAEDFLKILKPIACALDNLQSQKTKLSDAVYIYKKLELDLNLGDGTTDIEIFKKRYKMALTSAHYAAYLLDPR